MRLTEPEIKNIIYVLSSFLDKSAVATLYLFGSRINDKAYGGDVDLLLVVDKSTTDKLRSEKALIVTDLSEKLDEQKVDLIITNGDELRQDKFLQIIYQEAELLFEWK